MGQVVHGASCPWGELSKGRVVHGASCPWGELSVGRVVYGASCRGASFDVSGASCLGASGPGTPAPIRKHLVDQAAGDQHSMGSLRQSENI
jgi:hypothetical protein